MFCGGIVVFVTSAVLGYRSARFTSTPSGGKLVERAGKTHWWSGGATTKLEVPDWSKFGMVVGALMIWAGLLIH